MQSMAPVEEYLPATQLVHMMAPAAEYLPPGHEPVTAESPTVAQKLPAGHSEHDVADGAK